METVATVCGVEIRTCDVYPREVVAFSNGKVVVYYWGGAEVARLTPSTVGHPEAKPAGEGGVHGLGKGMGDDRDPSGLQRGD